jgi:7-keto-8-aminopelargonate synthetase-like enzyme
VRLAPVSTDTSTWDSTELLLQHIVQACLEEDNILFTVAKYSKLDASHRPPPSIKVTVSATHTEQDIHAAVQSLVKQTKKLSI